MKRLGLGLGLLLSADLYARSSLAPLEAEPASARVAALGGAALALDQGDGWELDPSALAVGPAWSVSADEGLLALGLQRQVLGGRWSPAPGSAWGARLSHLSFGSLERRDSSGALLGSFEPRRVAAGLGFGWVAGPSVSLGSGFSYFDQELGEASLQAALAGLSARWSWASTQRLAAAAQASSAGLERLVLGAAGSLGTLSYALQASGEASATAWSLQAGLEQGLGPACLRLGWRQLGQDNAALAGLSFGGGLAWRGWSLDYAWESLGSLGAAQRLSVSLRPLPAASRAPEAGDAAPALPPIPSLPEALAQPAQPEPLSPPAQAQAPSPTAQVQPALQLEFKLADSPVDQAYRAEDLGDSRTAQARYEEALKQDPKDTRAWMGLGQLAYERGDLDTAVQCYEQVLRLNPTETELQTWLEGVKARRRGPRPTPLSR